MSANTWQSAYKAPLFLVKIRRGEGNGRWNDNFFLFLALSLVVSSKPQTSSFFWGRQWRVQSIVSGLCIRQTIAWMQLVPNAFAFALTRESRHSTSWPVFLRGAHSVRRESWVLRHRENTLFYRAVSSILSQRLLHKMTNTRQFWWYLVFTLVKRQNSGKLNT